MIRCPRCQCIRLKNKIPTNALSRRDNKTYICDQCGLEEAFVDAGMCKAGSEPYLRDVRFVKHLKEGGAI